VIAVERAGEPLLDVGPVDVCAAGVEEVVLA
jgi:hypothetical protein